MPNLEQLAARVEAAEGASRELDRDIVLSLYPEAQIGPYCLGDEEWSVFHAEPFIRNKAELPKFTASLDAAMMLVPEGDGIGWQVSGSGTAGVWRVSTNPDDYDANRFPAPLWQATADAATPALALASAALRARAWMEER